MKKLVYGLLITFALALIILPAASAETCEYEIQPGDTISKIASKFGTTIDAIVNANSQITDPHLIYAGATMTIPDCNPESQAASEEQNADQPAAEEQSPAEAEDDQQPTAQPSSTGPSIYKTHEGVWYSEKTCGRIIPRSNALPPGGSVFGQFGTTGEEPWDGQACTVAYEVYTAASDTLYIRVRYSKKSDSNVPIHIFVNDVERANFVPTNMGSWNEFTDTDLINIGSVSAGKQVISFATEGQQFGVADLNRFYLYR